MRKMSEILEGRRMAKTAALVVEELSGVGTKTFMFVPGHGGWPRLDRASMPALSDALKAKGVVMMGLAEVDRDGRRMLILFVGRSVPDVYDRYTRATLSAEFNNTREQLGESRRLASSLRERLMEELGVQLPEVPEGEFGSPATREETRT